LSDPKQHKEPEPELFELNELDKPNSASSQIPADAGHELSDFQLLFVGGKAVDPRKQAVAQAKAITEQAQAELADAQAKVDGIKKEGYEKGYEQGVSEGNAASSARIMAACDNLGRAVESLERSKAQVLSAMEDEIIALVQAVVDRIFMIQGAIHPELVRQVARSAVGKLSESDTLTLALNPSDLEIVEEFAPQIRQGLGALKLLNLVTDNSLHPGDCRVTTPDAQVEATMETRRQRIFAVLEDLAQRSEGLDLEALLQKTPPAVDAMREEAAQGKSTVTPDDFGSPKTKEASSGLEGLEDLEDFSGGGAKPSDDLEDW
jgi:flagellar assembly protein FliH